LFYRRITLCITVFGGFGAWGGIGLELHAPNKIKAHPPRTDSAPNIKINRAKKTKHNK
jgi:hypothetical protein